MKRIVFILCLLLIIVSCCKHYDYYRETNINGISSKYEKLSSLIKKKTKTYAADGVLVKNVNLIFLRQDTISKRCFTSFEIEQLKNIFLENSLLANEEFFIAHYHKEDLQECVGLFLAYFNKTLSHQGDYPVIPFFRLADTILVNTKGESNVSQETEDFIRNELSKVYDSTEVNTRIDAFKKGKYKNFLRISRY